MLVNVGLFDPINFWGVQFGPILVLLILCCVERNMLLTRVVFGSSPELGAWAVTKQFALGFLLYNMEKPKRTLFSRYVNGRWIRTTVQKDVLIHESVNINNCFAVGASGGVIASMSTSILA